MVEAVDTTPSPAEIGGTAADPMSAMLVPRRPGEKRSPERLWAHYVVERRLADQLRGSQAPEERRRICSIMYDELFRHVPDHPRLTRRDADTSVRDEGVEWDLAQLRPYLRAGGVFLEIGAGDCALARRVAAQASRVYAVELCDQTRGALPPNLEVVLSDGRSIPVPEASVDVAFSDQLMEHLHPDDALEQLENIRRALRPGGAYVCITPNRLYGPSDVSVYFEETARGFHLREYTVQEICDIFAKAGFRRLHVYVGARGTFLRCPAALVIALEKVLDRLRGKLPPRLHRRIVDSKLMRAILGLRVAAFKE